MKPLSFIAPCVVVGWILIPSFALANPALLPKHPGYPMDKAVRSGPWTPPGERSGPKSYYDAGGPP